MLYYEQNFHCDKGVKLYIHSDNIINIEKNLEFTEKVIEMIREYNKSLMEGENMQTIELTKEEMSIIYDMRTKKAEKLKTIKASFERKNDTVYMHYIDENGKKQYNCSYDIDTNLLFEILTELQRKNNGNT